MKLYNHKDNNYHLYFNGCIEEKNINFIYKKQKKTLSQDALNFIEDKWKLAVEKNPNDYNGCLLDILSVNKQKENLVLLCDYTDYKNTIGTRNKGYAKFRDEGQYSSNHLSISPLIKTKDDKILIGSDLSFRNKLQSWKFPGGYFDPSIDKTISDCVERELKEELGFLPITNNKIIGISKNLNHNFALITCLIDCNKTSDEIIVINDNSKNELEDHEEMQTIKFIDYNKESIASLLHCNLISLSPSTIISLKLLELKL